MSVTRRSLLAAGGGAGLLPEHAFAQGQPRRGGTFTSIMNPEPPILHPGLNNQMPTLIIAGKMFQGLLTYTKRLEPLPVLAKSWQVSPDGREYLFTLQDNVKFHDGRPMTPDDVLFSITKWAPEVSPRARSVLALIKESDSPAPNQVRFVLEKPFEPFLLIFDVTTLPIVPKHAFEGQDFRRAPAAQSPIGTGPFKFAEWQRGNFARFERFADYWRPGMPFFDQLIYRVIPDSQSRRLALETGQVMLTQATDIEPFDIPQMGARPNLAVDPTGWEYFSPLGWIELNHRVQPLGDVRVRRAMSMALNREFLASRIHFGTAKPATGPLSASTRFYDANIKLPGFDVRGANALLDAAGYRPNAQGIRFSLKHLVPPYGEIYQRQSEFYRQAMRAIGIEFVLETTDAGGWAQRVQNWEYETTNNLVYQYGDPTLGVERTYVTSNILKVLFANTGGYSNPKVDELFLRGRDAASSTERGAIFNELQKLLVEEVPQIWTIEANFPTVYDKRLQNVITTGTGVHRSFDDLQIA
ncbi:ABC transporter substrate-binding protein [Roseococcus sp. YIM B11640]|uniref:ABC transporter substrate-binding protein n=1 Tax=Roseococcus sp. YIM B11640 TaxID=3133973 RepID=UPI003C7C99D1